MLLSLALAAAVTAAERPKPEIARFKTSDGVALVGEYLKPKPGKPTAILLHGVAAGRQEWWRLAAALHEKGIGSLALDFRGHGLSGGPRFETFKTEAHWAALEKDIVAAVRHVGPAKPIALVGASLGANLAAKAAAKDARVRCLALLSPGIEYRGVGLEGPLKGYERPLLIAASPPDRYAFETLRFLRGRLPESATVLQASSGHGAQMLEEPEFLERLAGWIATSCSRSPSGRLPKPSKTPGTPASP